MKHHNGCPFCKHLECTDTNKELWQNFKCLKNPSLKLMNAGAKFIMVVFDGKKHKRVVVDDCTDFEKK